MLDVEIGNAYVCQPVGAKKTLVGVIEKLYEHTALVKVTDYEMEDQSIVLECNQRMLVKFDKITAVAVA